ncbi:acid-soluble spore protein N [Bacillus solimangrovi]|uniref:Small, acid-soluble spore protein N n=1 Tax=Bacillus solimangrovi TaxID=1305675 RepID=A0A1E5LEI5_9BACI|nr:acid-soluble spore protein N [Bacillus solimangrovi]OEH92484.1 acid-soluble spore protein N [Bacillus solimangrovi]
MGNPKRNPKDFVPRHPGTQPRESTVNNGKKRQNKTGDTPTVIQTKGE